MVQIKLCKNGQFWGIGRVTFRLAATCNTNLTINTPYYEHYKHEWFLAQ